MIKLNCGFSRKVGQANYGSQGASVNLELELATDDARDADALHGKIRRLFALAKRAVDNELNDRQSPAEPGAQEEVPAGVGQGDNAGHVGGNGDGHSGNGSSTVATTRQVKLIMALARAREMNLAVLQRLCQQTCGVGDVPGLSKSQASAVIDRLKEQDSPSIGRNGDSR